MRRRLDQTLVVRGLTSTRARARDLIKRGEVRVDGEVVTKAGAQVDDARDLTVSNEANRFVARSAEKLAAALKQFDLPLEGRVALDVGASTGGFTQVLLEHGASYVYAVDVGQGQLHPTVQADPRVADMPRTDIRNLLQRDIEKPITAITADVSFISLTKALPNALGLAAPGCWIVALVKPQFELEPKALGKGGIVKLDSDRQLALECVREFLVNAGWSIDDTMPSPLPGKRGNLEYLIAAHLRAQPIDT